jgi:hypothetical protein
MRWWQVGVLAGVVLFYSLILGLKEHRLAEAEAERDRLAGQLSRAVRDHDRADALRDEVRRLNDYITQLECDRLPRRGPYPDGQSSEKYDPPPVPVRAFGFGVRGNGVWTVTGDPPACAAGPLVWGLPSPPTAGEVPHP